MSKIKNGEDNKFLFKANIFRIAGLDVYSNKNFEQFCKSINDLKNSEQIDKSMILNKVGIANLYKKISLPNNETKKHVFKGSVDYGEKLCILDVTKIDFVELFEENRDIFNKALLDKNEEYGFSEEK